MLHDGQIDDREKEQENKNVTTKKQEVNEENSGSEKFGPSVEI